MIYFVSPHIITIYSPLILKSPSKLFDTTYL